MGYDYTSGRIKTKGLMELLYGRVEGRAKLPTGRGTWPAIWMARGQHRPGGVAPLRRDRHHGERRLRPAEDPRSGPHRGLQPRPGNHRSGTIEASPPSSEDFHVYSMEWSPDRIDVFLDGERYFTSENEGTGTAAWPFDQPHFIILNLAIGGSWGGQEGIDDSLFPHFLYVDYMRVYQRQ